MGLKDTICNYNILTTNYKGFDLKEYYVSDEIS